MNSSSHSILTQQVISAGSDMDGTDNELLQPGNL